MGKLIIEGNNIYEIDEECNQERNHRLQNDQNLQKENDKVNELNRRNPKQGIRKSRNPFSF